MSRVPGCSWPVICTMAAVVTAVVCTLSSSSDSQLRPRYDHTFKVVVAGDSGVGKSSLILRYADNTFNPSYTATIGVDFKIRVLEVDGKRVKLQIWDTAGQDRFRSIVSNYYRGAHGVLLVYDVSTAESFDHIPDWLDEVRGHAPDDVAVALVGNKCDVEPRAVPREMAEALAQDRGMDHFETSARTGANVEELFLQTARRMKARGPEVAEKPLPREIGTAPSGGGGCCGSLLG